MESKKSPIANLERKRPLFLAVGAIVALSFSLVAFEWKTPYDKVYTPPTGDPIEIIDIGDILPLKIEEEVKKEEKVVKKTPSNDFKIVEKLEIPDETNIEEKPVEKMNINDLVGKTLIIDAPIGKEEKKEEEKAIRFAAKMPMFKCMNDKETSEKELYNHIKGRLRYPNQAVDYGIEGRVIVEFVVDRKGKVKDAKILRGIGYGCDEEVMRVVSNLPDFCPGYDATGKYRDIYYTLPVKFELP